MLQSFDGFNSSSELFAISQRSKIRGTEIYFDKPLIYNEQI